jgi:SEC-C motif-containing protein
MENCLCGSDLDRASCCGPVLDGASPATTAEGLMRARFSAYATRNLDFIINSTLPTSRSDSDLEAMRAWAEQAEWEGLEVVSTQKGAATDTKGEVEFIARYKLQGVPHHHHEKSEFVKQDGLWFFKDGAVVYSGPSNKPKPVVNTVKAGRNDPCPCGSGQKFKKCCGL